MAELTPRQTKILERLFAAGFRPLAIAPYESALCIRRGECAALLSSAPGEGLRLLAPPTYLVAGNLSVRLKRGKKEVFVWKKNEIEATPARLDELGKFRDELSQILKEASDQ